MAKPKTKSFSLLRNAVNTLAANPAILFPYTVIAFIQLLILEIICFAPRPPLSHFFAPLITRLWGERFLHYPFNITVIPKMFQSAQLPVFILISSYFICVSIAIIHAINIGEKVRIRPLMRRTLGVYVHILLAALLSYLMVLGLFKGYSYVYARALEIRSQAGPFFWLKTAVISSVPFLNLLFSVFVSTLMAYVFPAIVIDRKKFFAALGRNFKMLLGCFWSTFFVVLLPSLLYILVMILKKNVPGEAYFPEMRVISVALSVFIIVIIDAVVYTALTIRYLLIKEST